MNRNRELSSCEQKDDIKLKVNQIVDFVLFCINVLVVVFSVMGVLSYLMPSFLLSIVSSMMLLPLFFANVGLILIMKIRGRWSRLAFLSGGCILAIGAVIFSFSLFASWQSSENSEKTPIDVVSYNVCSFNRYRSLGESVAEIAFWTGEHDFEIMAFQEYSTCGEDSFYKLLSREYNIATSLTPSKRGISNGLAIVAKFPILETQQCKTEDDETFALYCDLKVADDTIRVLNVHLHSTAINQNIKGVASQNHTANRQAMKLLSEVCDNAESRYVQAECVARIIEQSPYRVVVCGDINDTPSSLTYKTLRGELKDSFYEAGFGYSYTYFGYYRTQRIDNIFMSPDFEVSEYSSPNIEYSDHKPVVARIDI